MVLVSAAALVMLPLPVETCTVRVMVPPAPAGWAARVTVRAALLVLQMPTLVSGADQGQRPTRDVSQGDVSGCARPALPKVMT